MSSKENPDSNSDTSFKEGRDYYFNKDGYMVLTKEYLSKRGYCCKNGCINCPYKK